MAIEFQHSSSPVAQDSSGSETFTRRGSGQTEAVPLDRLRAVEVVSIRAPAKVDQLLTLAKRGLPRMHTNGSFGHTLRGAKTASGWVEQLEGRSLRYSSMVALGLSCTDEMTQRHILAGGTAAELARTSAEQAEGSVDPGAIALSAWAAAEVANFHATALFRRLAARLATDTPWTTVECAWTLIAALAARPFGDTADIITLASEKLIAGWSGSGLFPHTLPASAGGSMRAHISCFADQVYPIQALSRLYVACGDVRALSAAEACAERICALQGQAGQWWWHYDSRDGSVVEGYPVYSVHQHAMAPMALLELREAGGGDYCQAVVKGLGWLDDHPETPVPLVCPDKGVIWRKVARREPGKAVRLVSATTTALVPGWRLPGIDALFPPIRIDYECRPYELGWLLYAWLSGGAVAALAAGR